MMPLIMNAEHVRILKEILEEQDQDDLWIDGEERNLFCQVIEFVAAESSAHNPDDDC